MSHVTCTSPIIINQHFISFLLQVAIRAPQQVAEIPTNNANSPFVLRKSLTIVALGLAMDLVKLSLGVPLRWIVQAIMWVVRAIGEIVHHLVLVCYTHILLFNNLSIKSKKAYSINILDILAFFLIILRTLSKIQNELGWNTICIQVGK